MARAGEDVVIDERAVVEFLTSPAGPVGRYIATLAARVTEQARANAPVGDRSSKLGHPAGFLRSQIFWRMDADQAGIYADIISPALTSEYNPHPRASYGLFNEDPSRRPYKVPKWISDKEGPYLRPALESIIGSL